MMRSCHLSKVIFSSCNLALHFRWKILFWPPSTN